MIFVGAATAVAWYPWISTSRAIICVLQRNEKHPLMAPLVAKMFECWGLLFLHAVLRQCCSFGLRFYLQVGAWSGWRERRRSTWKQSPISRFTMEVQMIGGKLVQWILSKKDIQLHPRAAAQISLTLQRACSMLYKHGPGFVSKSLLDAPPVDDPRCIDPASMLYSTAIDGFRGDAGICGPRGQSIPQCSGGGKTITVLHLACLYLK